MTTTKLCFGLEDFDPADYDEGEAPTEKDLGWYCPDHCGAGVLDGPGLCPGCSQRLACYDTRE